MRLIVLGFALLAAFIAAPIHDKGCRWSPWDGFEGDCRVMDGGDDNSVITDDGAPF